MTNVDEATLQGVEADVRWRANEYVNLFAGVGLLDSEIDKYDGRPYTAGNKVPYAPEYTATAGVDFVVPMGNSGLSLIARLDASFTGETWFSAGPGDRPGPEVFVRTVTATEGRPRAESRPRPA